MVSYDPSMHITQRARVVGLLLALFVAMAPITPAAAAVPPVRITKVFYDPPGSDTRTNTHLNLEYVVITNSSAKPQTLTRWTLRDAQAHVFTFPAFTLAAGKSVTVHTGKGNANPANRYYNSGNYIWNNTGDTATLKNNTGQTISTCGWTSRAASGYKNC